MNADYGPFFAQRVRNLKTNQAGTQGYGLCPFHDDKLKSISINLVTSQWMCHACGAYGNITTFCQRLGIDVPSSADTSPVSGGGSSYPARSTPLAGVSLRQAEDRVDNFTPRELVATYIYQYEDGSNAFRVLRYKPKSFVQQRWEKGEWVSGTSGIRRVPYRLPKLLSTDGAVIFVEGEKDVETLEREGFIATTTPMGANSWNSEYARYFTGKKVVILPDNDVPGKAFADKVALDLAGVAKVKVVVLPGLPEKGDVTDFFQSGRTRDELRSIINGGAIVTKKKPADPLQYFDAVNLHVPDGRGLMPHEYKTLCGDVYGQLTEKINLTNAVFEKINTLERFWKSCRTRGQYLQFLKILKEIHETGVAA